MNSTFDIESQLPLTETTLLILLSLAEEPRHGYAIMKDVENLSNGRVSFSTGTLYGALKRLLDQAWIERIEKIDEKPEPQNRPRKAYTLTDLGANILQAELKRIQSIISAARLRTAGRQI